MLDEYETYQMHGFGAKCPICGNEARFLSNVRAREEAFRHLITVHGMEASQALEIVNNLELKIDPPVGTPAMKNKRS